MAAPNVLLLAADKPSQVLTILRGDPQLASSQDEHGYSLVHAAASYNHLDLLRALVNEFKVDVNIKDEDGETALFVVETAEAAKVLVEELHADTKIQGDEGHTAWQKIELEGDFPEVAAYLLRLEAKEAISAANGNTVAGSASSISHPAPVPEGLEVNLGSMNPEEVSGEVFDPELKRRIDELASRPDFHQESGQQALRDLITAALRGQASEDREVRQRTE